MSGRPGFHRHVAAGRPRTRRILRRVAAAIAIIGAVAGGTISPALAAAPGQSPATALASPPAGPPPVLAYYYMWFNAASWNHAKTDVPALGPYTSTDPAVIRQHVTWARQTGIDAFIVSWKSTPALNLALSELVAECRAQGLKLVLLYEGLDVNRNPIPTATVESDLVSFMSQYGSDPVFDVFGKTAIIWSGTWRFSDSDVATVRTAIGAPDNVLLLGSEKGASTYAPRATLLDGDAYYWSSGDPLHTPGYLTRLKQLADVVHAAHGLWLAPAAAGFDAQLNGGTTIVDRRDGATLRAAWADAQATNPDGLAVISWNEFTENSYIEPSQGYGLRYLQVLASLTGAPGVQSLAIPSATPNEVTPGATLVQTTAPAVARPAGGIGGNRPPAPYDYTPALIVSVVAFLLLAVLGFNLRRRAGKEADDPDSDGDSSPGLGGNRGSVGRPAR